MTFFYHHAFNVLICSEYFIKKKETNSTETVDEAENSHYYHILRLKLQIFFKNIQVFSFSEEQDLSNDDLESIISDKLASSDDDTENKPSNSFGLSTIKTVLSDHRQFNHTQYERLYKWLYFSHLKNVFMCKICTVFYGESPCPKHTLRGA